MKTTNGVPVDLSCAWFALYTHHQHEKAAAQILSAKGFEIFLPLYNTVHQWKDRSKELSLPLFPRYVFLHGGLDRRVQILVTPGVYNFVAIGGRPAVIPQTEIEAVRQAVESFLRLEPHPFLKSGDWVRVKSGPLEGIEGILVRKKNLSRLVLSVQLLEKSVAVEVNASVVERAPKQNAAAVVSQSSCTSPIHVKAVPSCRPRI